MIADEADQDGQKQFLVFAAVFFPATNVLKLHNEVLNLRKKFGYGDEDVLKSSPKTKPKHVSSTDHAEIKNAILDLAAAESCKVCCYVVPHDIAKGQKHADRLKFGTNTLLGKFDQFLLEHGKCAGMAFFDTTTDYKQADYFREVFTKGVTWNDGTKKRLRYIVSIDNTGISHSHLVSVTDIVVGHFRFVANEPDKDVVGKILIKQLEKTMWGVSDENGILNVGERGVCIRPRVIKSNKYKADIAAFMDRLTNWSE